MISYEQQIAYLKHVSRSFALTIPLLDHELRDVIANAYLHLRIIDTLEDDDKLSLKTKVTLLLLLKNFYEFKSHDLVTLSEIKDQLCRCVTSDNNFELDLIKDYVSLHERTLKYKAYQQDLIFTTATIMCDGMVMQLQNCQLKQDDDVDRYCYSVAGVVGEFLARLFAHRYSYSKQQDLIKLSVSFGQGLQLTNILKDRQQDAKRDVSYLPNDAPETIRHYIALTSGHLDNAMSFIAKLNRNDKGNKMFCLVNVAMAYETLKLILEHPHESVKISHAKLKFILIMSRMAVNSNIAFNLLKIFCNNSLPKIAISASDLYNKVSRWKNHNKD